MGVIVSHSMFATSSAGVFGGQALGYFIHVSAGCHLGVTKHRGLGQLIESKLAALACSKYTCIAA